MSLWLCLWSSSHRSAPKPTLLIIEILLIFQSLFISSVQLYLHSLLHLYLLFCPLPSHRLFLISPYLYFAYYYNILYLLTMMGQTLNWPISHFMSSYFFLKHYEIRIWERNWGPEVLLFDQDHTTFSFYKLFKERNILSSSVYSLRIYGIIFVQ